MLNHQRLSIIFIICISSIFLPFLLIFNYSAHAYHSVDKTSNSALYSEAATIKQTENITTTEPLLWGEVFEFGEDQAIAGVLVVIQTEGGVISTTTIATALSGTTPLYRFSATDLTNIGVYAGDWVTMTATMGGYSRQYRLTIPTQSTYYRFLLGGRCHDYNPFPDEDPGRGLPDEDPGRGLPDEDPGRGLPDVACFWGYGRINGQPYADVQFNFDINDNPHSDYSKQHIDDPLPYYGVRAWGAQYINGQQITVTAVYSEFMVTKVITVALDESMSQRIDIELVGGHILNNYSNGDQIRDLAWGDGFIWAATNGGVLRWQTDDHTYTQWTSADGLPTNNTHSIAIAPDNTIWIAAGSNIAHFQPEQPKQWETFNLGSDVEDRTIKQIEAAADGSIWFTTGKGIMRMTPTQPPAVEQWTTSDGLGNNIVLDFAIAPDESLWIGTKEGVTHLIPGDVPVFELYNQANGLIHDHVTAVAAAPDNSVWFGTPIGVSHFRPESIPVWRSFTDKEWLIGYGVQDIVIAPDLSVWFGTDLGVSHLTLGNNVNWEIFDEPDRLPYQTLSTLLMIPDGALWAGTTHGMYRNENMQWQKYTTDSQLPQHDVQAISTSNNGTTWFAMPDGLGQYLPGGTPEWKTYTQEDGLLHNSVLDVASVSDGSVWLATKGGVSHYIPGNPPVWESFTTKDGLPHYQVNALMQADDGSMWFATAAGVSHLTFEDGGTIENFSTADGLNNYFVNDIVQAKDGTIWAATKHGASRYRPNQTPSWENYTVEDGLAHNLVWAVAAAEDGAVWFGTHEGVSRFNPNSNLQWETYRIEDGLIRNRVYAIEIDNDGSLWFGTKQGVSHYIPYKNSWDTVTIDDGLSGNVVRAITVAVDDTIWFGTEAGATQWTRPQKHSDLSVAISGAETAVLGEPYSVTLTLTNHGNLPTAATTLSLTIPGSSTFISATSLPRVLDQLQWDLPPLAPKENMQITAVVQPNREAIPTSSTPFLATADTNTPEISLRNNQASLHPIFVDLTKADVQIAVTGPPLLLAGTDADYVVSITNLGGAVAEDVTLNLTLTDGLQYISSTLPTENDLQWRWPFLAGQSDAVHFKVRLQVTNTFTTSPNLSVSAEVTTVTDELDLTNNQTQVTLPSSLTTLETLILVAPERMGQYYGATDLMPRIYDLAQHERVQGAVLDITQDTAVAEAYHIWDVNPSDWQAANTVATSIRDLIQLYLTKTPSLQYLVIVGGDEIIPFYRVDDKNETHWQENIYHSFVPPHATVHHALAANKLLTDDFYVSTTPLIPDSPFWYGETPLLLPSLAIGRLVESPAEINTVIDAFLLSDGQILLETGIVNADPQLTDDWRQSLCQQLESVGVEVNHCSNNNTTFRDAFLTQATSSLWTASHSTHFNMGPLSAADLLNRNQEQLFAVAAGCHAGLPVSDDHQLITTRDLSQAILGQGGTYVASTGYTFGSIYEIAYTEALINIFTEQLFLETKPTIGKALMHAKQTYYDKRVQWVDHMDEKVVSPMTLYGLPMQQLIVSNN